MANYITTVEAADEIFAKVRTVFKPKAGIADILGSDVVARKAVVNHTDLLDEEEKVEAANGYLEMASFFRKADENKAFVALLDASNVKDQNIPAGRARIMKTVGLLRKRVRG
jgi:hypothetical protein